MESGETSEESVEQQRIEEIERQLEKIEPLKQPKDIQQQIEIIERCMEISTGINFLDLPPEIILAIFQFVDFRTLFGVVVLTCKRFHEILSSEDIWKTLFAMKWKEDCIVSDLDYISDEKDVCFSYEDIDTFWKQRETKVKVHVLLGFKGNV